MLLTQLKKTYPELLFEPGEAFYWSPKDTKIIYKVEDVLLPQGSWALLHETSHALLGHTSYQRDLDLLLLEVEAWQKAKQLAQQFGIEIDEEHIQDCLDTYRDWLHQRATCPACETVSLQISSRRYRCHNCGAIWRVSASRFCRPYRLHTRTHEKSPKATPQTTFQ
jgi:hypothetical protein